MGYLVNSRVEHQAEHDEVKHQCSTRETEFRKTVRGQGSQRQVTQCTAGGNEYRVKDIAGEGYPRVRHQDKEVGIVFKREVLDIESRREHKQLIQRLEGLNHNIVHRDEHEKAEDDKDSGDTSVAASASIQDNAVSTRS